MADTFAKRRHPRQGPVGAPIADAFTLPEQILHGDHGGIGPIRFRRLLDDIDLDGIADFVDLTVIPPGSTIGLHHHSDSLELYFIIAGNPLVTVDDQDHRLGRGGLALVHPGGSHGLTNDSNEDVVMLVVQIRASR
jgi:Cupin domain